VWFSALGLDRRAAPLTRLPVPSPQTPFPRILIVSAECPSAGKPLPALLHPLLGMAPALATLTLTAPVLAAPLLAAPAQPAPAAASPAPVANPLAMTGASPSPAEGPATAPLPAALPSEQASVPAQVTETAPQSPPSPSPWASTLELYGFLPLRTETGLEIGQRSTSFDVGLGTLLSKLKWASSARGSVEYGRIGLLGDVRYDRLGAINSRTGPRGLVGVKTQTSFNATVADLALRYRFGARESAQGKAGDFSIIPYAGVRIIDTNFGVTATVNVLQLERQFSRDLSHTWVQALLGTQATVFLAPRLRLFGRADVGGFGQGESQNLSGNAQLGLGYALGHNTDLNISWRYQGLEWNNGAGGRQQRGISSDANGIEIGLKFFF